MSNTIDITNKLIYRKITVFYRTLMMIMISQTILNQIPACVFWKDCNFLFRGGNQLFLSDAGLQSIYELYGKSDYDLPWAPYADLYRERDAKVLLELSNFKGNEKHLNINNKKCYVWVNKSPLYDDSGKLVGVIGCYVEQEPFNKLNLSLPSRQSECLNYLQKGLSSKQIAHEMNLSVRTVEYYIDILKKKFNCRNKLELLCMIHFRSKFL